MKNVRLFIAGIFVVVLAACSDTATQQASTAPITRMEEVGETNATYAKLAISGMTCSHACGGKIMQELQALNGVKATDLDYADDRSENIVKVEFDPSVLTEQQMINCVNGIADGMYQVKSVEVVEVKANEATSSSVKGSDVSELNFGWVFQVFNTLHSFLQLVK